MEMLQDKQILVNASTFPVIVSFHKIYFILTFFPALSAEKYNNGWLGAKNIVERQ